MNSPPPVYEMVRKSRLIPEGDLQTALAEFLSADALENHSSAEEFDDAFLSFLKRDLLLNRWQISQLKKGRSRFRLGKYRVIDSLGSGGYGYVFLARTDDDTSNFSVADSDGHRPYDRAIKTLIHSERHGERAVERFRRENEINRLFLHPNLVRLLDSGEDGKVDYAVYEYMDGKSAFQLVAKAERLPGNVASYIISETAKGLFHLHQHGFIHRDIKPGNILFSLRGEVKLGDLGLAVPMDFEKFRPLLGGNLDDYRSENGGRSRLAGTSDYLSPDQIRSPGTPNVRWDIYSLGCTFFFLVAGFVPFPSGTSHQKLHAHLLAEAPDPKMYSPELPWEVARLISAMMDKDPSKRPASAEEIIKSLASHTVGGQADLKRLLKESFAPDPKPHYKPVPVAHDIDDGSESVLLEALSSEISESLSSNRLFVDDADLDEILPPVIDRAEDDADDGPFDEATSGPDLAATLGPLLWFIAALVLALFAVLLFR
ncbi:MAG: serine/threonine protein kinase [Thermoguttaceae bacterium]|nr:serine/threonine protein kinase [Thermoguttaceae bacterium]